MKMPQEQPKQGRLIAYRSDRLGARIISIINTLRLARQYDYPCTISWLRKWDLTEPGEIFDQSFMDDYFISREDYVQGRTDGAPVGNFASEQSPARLEEWLKAGKDIIVDPPFGVFCFPYEQEETVKPLFLAALRSIAFNPDLTRHMQALEARLKQAPHRVIAYHIRRGDLTGDIQAMNRSWPNKFVPDEFFEAHIAARLADKSETILFSDNAHVLKRYCAMFPKLKTFRDIMDVTGLPQSQVDFLELYAMSCCSHIVAPPESAFSSAARTIGEASFADVESELTEEERAKALELLYHNLRHNPDSFTNEGEVGQYLVYAEKYLRAENRLRDLADLLLMWVDRGISIAYIFAMLFKALYELEDYQGLIAARRYVDAGHVYFQRPFAQIALYQGCSHLNLDEKEKALHYISNAFWHEPVEGEINVLCAVLYAQGDFNKSNFWFTDPVISRYMQNSWSLTYLEKYYKKLIMEGRIRIPRIIPTCRMMVWEWDAFTRPHLNNHYRYRGQFLAMLKILNQRTWSMEEAPNADSFYALCSVRQGDVDKALEKALNAVEARPDEGLFHKHLADVHFEMKAYDSAAQHLQEALRLEPGTMMYHAQLGHVLAQKHDYQGAVHAFRAALVRPTGFASIYHQAYEAAIKLDDREQALSWLETGLELYPQEWHLHLERAKLLKKMRRMDEARAVMEKTWRWSFSKASVGIYLSKLQEAMGETDKAIATLERTFALNPERTGIAEDIDYLRGGGRNGFKNKNKRDGQDKPKKQPKKTKDISGPFLD